MTRRTMKDENLEKQIEKQMGCMAGFFQIFDRHQIITGKRLYSSKRIPHFKVVDDESSSEMSGSSTPAISRELEKPQEMMSGSEHLKKSPAQEPLPPKTPHRLSAFELKEENRSSWKFTKETPRLSLDSRAIVDSKGSVRPREIRTNASILTANRTDSPGSGSNIDGEDKQRRSPSVIARLMGLEQLPDSTPVSDKAQLRRSSSESRVARDLFNYRSVDNSNSSQLLKQPNQSHSDLVVQNLKATAINQTNSQYPIDVTRSGNAMESHSFRNAGATFEQQKAVNRGLGSSQWKSQHHRKSFFDTADVFPEPKQTMSEHADIEKKLKVRGIDEASKDLETLKQILEALQLKGLLHSRRTAEHQNLVYDRFFPNEESPIVVMKASGSPYGRRSAVRRNLNETLSSVAVSPRRSRPQNDRNLRSPTRTWNSPPQSESNERRNANSLEKTKPLSVETQRRRNESTESRKTSPVQSPKIGSNRTRPTTDPTVTSKSPRYKRSTADNYQKEKITTVVTEDESSSISESTFSTSSQPDTERSKTDEYREGKSLLERCDKLLHSIAEMNASEMQPSPVSVLDSSTFYKEDSSASPSPVLKRVLDFKDVSGELEEEWWSSILQSDPSKLEDSSNQDPDFVYISEILRAFDHLPEDTDIFLLLEKQQYLRGEDTSKASMLHRRLIFDMIIEIFERNRQMPPWKASSWTNQKPLLQNVWIEFQRIRDRQAADDLCQLICGVLEKDLAADAVTGWEDCPVELSEAVLDVERLMFKDLIGETIRELAIKVWRIPVPAASRRKLVF